MFKAAVVALACVAVNALPVTTVNKDKSIFALQLDAKAVAGVQLAEADQKMGWYGVHKNSTLGQAGYRFWAPRKDGVDFKGEKAALSCNTQKTAVKADKHVIQYVCNTVDTNTARFSQVKTKDFWNVCASASITAPPCQDDAEKYIAYALDSSGYYGCTKIGPNGYCAGDVNQYPITGSYFGGFNSGAPLDKDGGFDIVTGPLPSSGEGSAEATNSTGGR